MSPAAIRSLVADYRRRAATCGENLSAETAWHLAADLLEDAAKQDRAASRNPRKTRKTRKTLGLRLNR